jgi:hypothetical protein
MSDVTEDLTNSALNQAIDILPETVASNFQYFLFALQAIGVLFILYVIYLLFNALVNYKRYKLLRKIDRRMDKLESKMDKIYKNFEKKHKKK